MNSLKSDGTFSSSSGALSDYHDKIAFIRNTYMIESYTYRKDYSFYVYGQKATEEDFHNAVNREDIKPDVTWHEYSEKNIKKLFS